MLQRTIVGALVLGALLASRAAAQNIVGATRLGTSGNTPPQVVIGGLQNCAPAFVDRTHAYTNVPEELLGIDYVMVANNDKSVVDYELEVEVDGDGELLLFIDYRIGDDANGDPPTLGAGIMDWVLDLGFEDTGIFFDIDEGPSDDTCSTVDQYWAVWSLEVEEGSTLLGVQDNGGGRNMYGVAFLAEGASRPCPLGLRAVLEGADVAFTWVPGDGALDGVDVTRNGELIADDAPVDPPEYRDVEVPPGAYSYSFAFSLPGGECDVLTAEIDTCISDARASVTPDGVALTWTNGGIYEGIRVMRGDEELDVLPGDQVDYLDFDPPLGEHVYSIAPSTGICEPATVTVVLSESQGIVSAERLGLSGAAPPVIVPAGLQEGVAAYVDRVHAYVNVPEELLGADYIQVANDDKATTDYALEVEVDRDGVLYLLIDHRIGDDSGADGPTLGAGIMDWVLDAGFEDTGLVVDIDEGNNGSIENFFAVYALEVEGDEIYSLFEQNNGGGRNMYGVAFKDGGGIIDPPGGPEFVRGDADGSGAINITDGIFVLNFLFLGGAGPGCADAADADDSNAINITDGIYILNFLFLGGGAPAAPYPDCGEDADADAAVGCETAHGACA